MDTKIKYNKLLKIIIIILSMILLIVAYIIYDLAFEDAPPKPKVTFEAKTPEGKLREISEHARQ